MQAYLIYNALEGRQIVWKDCDIRSGRGGGGGPGGLDQNRMRQIFRLIRGRGRGGGGRGFGGGGQGPVAEPGEYTVQLTVNDETYTQILRVEDADAMRAARTETGGSPRR